MSKDLDFEHRLVGIAYEILIDKIHYLKAFQVTEYGGCEGWFQGELLVGLRNRGIQVTKKGSMSYDCDLIVNSSKYVELKGTSKTGPSFAVLKEPFREHPNASLVLFLFRINQLAREWLERQPKTRFIFRDLTSEWIVGVALQELE